LGRLEQYQRHIDPVALPETPPRRPRGLLAVNVGWRREAGGGRRKLEARAGDGANEYDGG
jgi:hypothetical protein